MAARDSIRALKQRLSQVVLGQEELLRDLLLGLIADGHVLVEGVPGLAKTRAVRALAEACGLAFKRLQFTPDLLPGDILGTRVYNRQTAEFETVRGPIFANFVLADEINRAPAKVQSALLETMQERQVTIGHQSLALEPPFLVFATQNPVEQEGTYRLPEAQLDRFLLKAVVGYPREKEEAAIVELVIGERQWPRLEPVVSRRDVLDLQEEARGVFAEARVIEYAVALVRSSRPEPGSIEAHVSLGSSPRGSIALIVAGRAHALLDGRDAVLPEDVKAVAPAVLRHRLLLTYVAEAEGITPEALVEEILGRVPVP